MPHLYFFILAALVLALTPGPGMFYVVGRTWSAGRRDGLASSLGTMVGGFVHVVACMIGVSALVMASAKAFAVLKFCGGLYLIYLGIQTWRSASREDFQTNGAERVDTWRAFRQGVIVEATNPKTAAFFLAFIPQFIVVSHGHVAQQFLFLGVLSVSLNTSADLLAVLGAAKLYDRFLHRPRLFRRLRQTSGAILASLGLSLIVSRRPA
jgi:threonine/homoserine/homoserine lactone efflux protein